MENIKKTSLCQELADLLAQWNDVLIAQAAAEVKYNHLKERITQICQELDAIERGEVGR